VIVALPAAIAVTNPPLTVAFALLLVQAPPEVASVNVTVLPTQRLADEGETAATP